jgi:hypothetical protein
MHEQIVHVFDVLGKQAHGCHFPILDGLWGWRVHARPILFANASVRALFRRVFDSSKFQQQTRSIRA